MNHVHIGFLRENLRVERIDGQPPNRQLENAELLVVVLPFIVCVCETYWMIAVIRREGKHIRKELYVGG